MESLSSRLHRILITAESLDFDGPPRKAAILAMRRDLENLEQEAKLLEISPGLPAFKSWSK
jgi:hypothetical protein